MATLVLTVIGDDRAGLVNALADVVTEHGGNWERSQMAELAGKFAGIVMVTVPDGQAEALVTALEPLQGMLDVTVQRGVDDDGARRVTALSLALIGTDRPGIVHDITRVLRVHDVNIGSLRTETRDAPMAGGRLFEAVARLEASGTTDLDRLRHALEELADELMVDIDIDVSIEPEP